MSRRHHEGFIANHGLAIFDRESFFEAIGLQFGHCLTSWRLSVGASSQDGGAVALGFVKFSFVALGAQLVDQILSRTPPVKTPNDALFARFWGGRRVRGIGGGCWWRGRDVAWLGARQDA